MPEVELAKIRWKAPLDDWSPLCDNRLELDRSTNLVDAPHKMNQFGVGIGAAKCEQCITSQSSYQCGDTYFPKWKKLPIVRAIYNGAFIPVISGDAYIDPVADAKFRWIDALSMPGIQSSFSGRLIPSSGHLALCGRARLGVSNQNVAQCTYQPDSRYSRTGRATIFFSVGLSVFGNESVFSANLRAFVEFEQITKSIPTLPNITTGDVHADNYAFFNVSYTSTKKNTPGFNEPEIGEVFQCEPPVAITRNRFFNWSFLESYHAQQQELPPEYLTVPDSVTIQILGY